MLTVFTSLACYLGATPHCHRSTAGCWAGIGGAYRFPVPRGGHLPLRAARLSLLSDSLEVLPRQLDGTTAGCQFILLPCMGHPSHQGVCKSAAACCSHALGTPSPWPAACPAHPGSLDMISMTFAAVI